MSRCDISSAATICMAVGNTSFDDWLSDGSALWRRARAAEHLVGAIGDHLVDVHIGLGARAGVVGRERKMLVVLAVKDFLRHLHDGLCATRVEKPERTIGLSGGALRQRQRQDHRARHQLFADRKIMLRALGLRPPIGVLRHRDQAERIGFGASLHKSKCFPGCGGVKRYAADPGP